MPQPDKPQKSQKLHCLICGRTSLRTICVPCAKRLQREAIGEQVEEVREGSRLHNR